MESLQNTNSILLFKVGPVLCCAPSNPVVSIITPPEITHPPGTSNAKPGIFKHNGKITNLSDLRQKFGISMNDHNESGKVIIVNISGQYTGFWVDEIIDVIPSPSQGWGMPPAYIPRDIFSGTLLYKDQIWLNSEFEKLLKMNEFGYLQTYINFIKGGQDNKTGTGPLIPETLDSKTRATDATNATDQAITTVPDNTAQDRENLVVQPITTADTPIEQSTEITPSPVSNIKDSNVSTHKDKAHHGSPFDTNKPVDAPQINRTVTTHKKESHFVVETTREIVAKSRDTITKKDSKESNTRTPEKTVTHSILHNVPTKNQSASISTSTENSVTTKDGNLMTGLLLLAVISVITLLLFLAYDWSTPEDIRITDSKSPKTQGGSKIKSDLLPKKVAIMPQTEIKEPATPKTSNTTVDSDLANIEHQQLQDGPASTTEQLAIIQKDEDGIIIELNPPLTLERKDGTEEVIATLEKHDQSQTNLLSDKAISNPKSIENVEIIEHIIVKGDTLWDIAKQYIHNPFRYPELARLSDIDNPDLIYPGNRVLIIKYPFKEKTVH